MMMMIIIIIIIIIKDEKACTLIKIAAISFITDQSDLVVARGTNSSPGVHLGLLLCESTIMTRSNGG